ncbi:hypothetical protein HDU77_005685 [Chytriomyces hyalinus]|nr:hypothetical protein HDU77_005685 [Chytriomyces hyalinus]
MHKWIGIPHKETTSGNGGVFHLRYAPVPVKFIISQQFDVYAKQSNKMLIAPKFWLVDKPAAEAGAVLYTEPVTHPIKIQMTKPLDTADTVTESCSMPPVKMKRISHSAPTMTDKKAVPLVSGWVAAQVQFFNNLAQRSTTPAATASAGIIVPKKKLSLSTESQSNSSLKEAAFSPTPAPASAPALTPAPALVPTSTPAQTPTSAPSPAPTWRPQPAHTPARTPARTPAPTQTRAVDTPSINYIAQEAQKWVACFSQHRNAENDKAGIILPPTGSPAELLASWFFLLRVAKKIITSAGGPYNEMLFFVAVAFLEIDSERNFNLAGDAL